MSESKFSGNLPPAQYEIKENIALSLKKARTEKGYSYRKAAKEIGVSVTTYCRWETGQNRPKNTKLIENFIKPVQKQSNAVQHFETLPEHDLPEKLKRARLKRGLTYQEAADEIGVSVSTYFQWEKRVFSPTDKNVLRIEKFINTDGSQLPTVPEALPEKLRKIRKGKGQTLRDAAREIGVPLCTYYQWKQGRYKPSDTYSQIIQQFLEQENPEALQQQ